MLEPVGFWSYARHDDEHSDGQLSQLRAIVGKAIGLRHGSEVVLWQDIAAIPPGADWAATIDATIAKTNFFIPVITPRFIQSEYCLAELKSFERRTKELGREDVIFPIHYVDVTDMSDAETIFGESMPLLKRRQWTDFRALLYSDPRSPEVKRWAGELAQGILHSLRKKAPMPASTKVEAVVNENNKETARPKIVLSNETRERLSPQIRNASSAQEDSDKTLRYNAYWRMRVTFGYASMPVMWFCVFLWRITNGNDGVRGFSIFALCLTPLIIAAAILLIFHYTYSQKGVVIVATDRGITDFRISNEEIAWNSLALPAMNVVPQAIPVLLSSELCLSPLTRFMQMFYRWTSDLDRSAKRQGRFIFFDSAGLDLDRKGLWEIISAKTIETRKRNNTSRQ